MLCFCPRQDVSLLFDNARSYNQPASEIYEDADFLQALFEQQLAVPRRSGNGIGECAHAQAGTHRHRQCALCACFDLW